ncbi:MAG TPA: hypothetical protein VMU07_03800 [Candidatus Paceibacterota bacterium]|nr:hypothetical protein [Candidatus Paceibacterota bacterium]
MPILSYEDGRFLLTNDIFHDKISLGNIDLKIRKEKVVTWTIILWWTLIAFGIVACLSGIKLIAHIYVRHQNLRIKSILHVNLFECASCETPDEYWAMIRRQYKEHDQLLRRRVLRFAVESLPPLDETQFRDACSGLEKVIMRPRTLITIYERKDLKVSIFWPIVRKVVTDRTILIVAPDMLSLSYNISNPPEALVADIKDMFEARVSISNLDWDAKLS